MRAGIEIGRQLTLRRRPALDLADHRDVAVRAAQRGREVARRRRVERVPPEQVTRLRPAQQGDLVAFAGEDVVENGHSVRASV